MADYAPEQLEALLAQLTHPDTQQIKQAEELLKAYLKKISSVAGLITQIQGSANPSVRQMAAIVLRKKLLKHWPKIDAQTQVAIKQALLQRSVEDPVHVVRFTIATLISSLATHEFKTGSWPELMIFINQAAASADENQRELSMKLLQLLGESMGTVLQPFFGDLKNLYANALQDPQSLKVRISAMRAACSLIEFLEENDLRSFQPLVPMMVEVLQQCVVNGAEAEAIELLDVLSEVVNHPFPLLEHSLGNLVEMLLQVLVHPSLESSTRASAAYAIGEFIKRKPKTIGKKGLVPKIFTTMLDIVATDDRAMCGLISNILDRDSEEADEDDDETPGHLAQQTLDTLALSVPAKYVNGVVFGVCNEYMKSPEPTRRKAGVLALGIISEGCHDVMCQNIKELLPPVFAAAQDADQRVRGASCFALGQFAEFLQPPIAEHYSEMLPLAIALLDDNTKEIKATALYVVEEITQSMDSHETRPYLDTLVTKLVNVLRTSTPQIQKMALDALGSIAVGAKEEFLPYLAPIAELITPFSNIEDPKFFFLRGAAMECLGYLAVAVGKEAFRPFYAPSMQFVMSSFNYEDTELKEQAFVFFINLSSVYKEEFQPFLEEAATFVLAEIENDDGIDVVEDDDDLPEGLQSDDEDDEDEDGDMVRHISIRTDALSAKVRAIAAVEEMALNCGPIFEQYIPRFLTALARHTEYIHEDVRGAVAEALAGLVICSFESAHPNSADAQVWVKGDFNKNILTERNNLILEPVVKGLVDELIQDSEEIVVEKALNALKVMSARIGPVVTLDNMSKITETIQKILTHDHDCQIGLELDEDEEETEGGSVLEAASELVGVLSKCYGDKFLETFKALFPNLIKFATSLRADRDRAAVVGCFAEVLREVGPAGQAYVEPVYPVVIQGLTSEHYVLRANSVFCVGILAEISGPALAGHYEQILHAVRPLFEESNDEVVQDNAAAAVARMIMTNVNSVPLEAVLPVFVGALPLKADADESPVVFKCLNGLVQGRNPAVMNLIPQVIEVYAKSFGDESVTGEEEQAEIKVVLRGLLTDFQAQTQGVISQLSPELQSALASALQ